MTQLSRRQRAIALALAQAVVPPGRVSTGADESTVARLEKILGASGELRRYERRLVVLDLMSRLARGARFTRLDHDEAEDLLSRWSRAGPRRRAFVSALVTPIKRAHSA